jgi:hypothetical protein
MKKIAILLVILFATASLTSCKSSKGCGLTGDVDTPTTNPIENISNVGTTVVA